MAGDSEQTLNRAGEPAASPPRSTGSRVGWAAVQALLALAVLGGGIVLAGYLLRTGPTAKRRTPEKHALLVSVRDVAPTKERAVVHAMGTVRPAQTISLQPRVSGEIVEVSPECIPGGRFNAGEAIARIDPADFTLAVEQQTTEVARLAAALAQKRAEVTQRESDIATAASAIEKADSDLLQREAEITKAEAALRIEQGQQAVSLREYEMLGRKLEDKDRDLVLRQPQLRTAEANIAAARAAKASAEAARKGAIAAKSAAEAMKRSAEAQADAAEAAQAAGEVALRKAKLDLARATLVAPFNVIVEAETVDLGSQVSPQTALATLVGTDEYWVEVSVPVDKLRWLRVPRNRGETGSAVRVFNEAAWGPGVSRTGAIMRLTSALETEGRMARLLVAVPDPLGLKTPSERLPALLIGSYVRVEMDGMEIENVVPLDRDLVHEGDQVWVMTPEGKLAIREVKVAFRGRDTLLVSGGLETGDKVVTTGLAAPVAGTPLRTAADAAPESRVAESTPDGGGKAKGEGQ